MRKKRLMLSMTAWIALALGTGSGFTALGSHKQPFRDTFQVDKSKLDDTGEGTYFILKPGYRLVLRHGRDSLIITVLDETKVVDGVTCRVVEERETKRGRLAEVSRNYFAIDRETGDVYYFGEDVNEYTRSGKVKSHKGSWISGENNARFGMLVPGKPTVGARYHQEIAPKVAMDRAEVLSVTETVKVPAGMFTNCLKTKESSSLEFGSEKKLYAPSVGLLKDGGFRLSEIRKPSGESTDGSKTSEVVAAPTKKPCETRIHCQNQVFDFAPALWIVWGSILSASANLYSLQRQ